jgi:hypothetical protein
MSAVHEITTDAHGHQVGTDGTITVSLVGAGRMFKRRAIKCVGTEAAQEVCWLVAELTGVRVYQHKNNIVITTEDLNP